MIHEYSTVYHEIDTMAGYKPFSTQFLYIECFVILQLIFATFKNSIHSLELCVGVSSGSKLHMCNVPKYLKTFLNDS